MPAIQGAARSTVPLVMDAHLPPRWLRVLGGMTAGVVLFLAGCALFAAVPL